MRSTVLESLEQGRGPRDDGWEAVYRLVEAVAPPDTIRRRLLCRYFSPSHLELSAGDRIYRLLGVEHFGKVIPTGGISVRRVSGWRMAPYTLRGTSLGAARDFYYRACVFEALHLPFFVTLTALSIQRAAIGRLDYALQETLINLVVNLYPMLHHRNTRRRIVRLLSRRGGRREGSTSGPLAAAGRGR